MGYYTFQADHNKWTKRKGLEGPFFYPNGQVLYYDSKVGEYWDPRTDFYVPTEQVIELKNEFFNIFKGHEQ